MKRLSTVVLSVAIIITMFGCSNKSEVNETIHEEGVYPYQLSESDSIDMHITAKGRFSQKGSPIDMESGIIASSRGFLTEFEIISTY